MLAQMFLAGAANLRSNKEWINELNVFPVPDGDTGTNMTMTIMSAVREVNGLGDEYDMMKLCKGISSGSLRGARGNSGVILSQLLRGFCKEVRENDEVDAGTIADAFDRAVDTAYKAVMKPKEGTILTVAKGVAVKTRELVETGDIEFDVLFPEIIAEAESVLAKTPDLLPVLKQAGVVDSGGQGLVQVLKGAYEGYQGKTAVFEEESESAGDGRKALVNPEVRANAEIKFGYCTEFIVSHPREDMRKTDVVRLRKRLERMGDCVLVISDMNVVKVHVHTNEPGKALQYALELGELDSIKIDNMMEERREREAKQAEEAAKKAAEQKEYGIVAVALGEGLTALFRDLNVDQIVDGGQTMNPSIQDLAKAADDTNARTVIILPNNTNIILAAQQASRLTDRKVIVLPTKSVPMGISAALAFDPTASPEENEAAMTEAAEAVHTASITYAVRDTNYDGQEIHEGDIMGMIDNKLSVLGSDIAQVGMDVAEKMVNEDSALITVYYGADTAEADAQALRDRLAEKYADCDVELQAGGQPLYYYLIAVE